MGVVSSVCLKTGVKTERPKKKNLKNTVEGGLGMMKNYNMKGEITLCERMKYNTRESARIDVVGKP